MDGWTSICIDFFVVVVGSINCGKTMSYLVLRQIAKVHLGEPRAEHSKQSKNRFI